MRKYKKRWNGPIASFSYSIANKAVLQKIRALLGGSKNFFAAGGAPLAEDIEIFFLSVGLLVCQGYGLTETSPVIACNTPSAFKFGTVGKPLIDVNVKIDLDTGEILAKGPNVTCGYYNKPELTAEAFTEDGWFKTGDVGDIDKDGYLRITDRIKDFIITSGGKNIAPLRIETIIGMDHYIEQICTIGDKRKYIVALIVPNFQALEEHAKSQNISFNSREELVSNPTIFEFYKERIDILSVELSQFEKIKNFHLLPKEFSQENGELTPSLKVKRKIIASNYVEIIEKLYSV
jgi:long-chain acyl-CoA synthetase